MVQNIGYSGVGVRIASIDRGVNENNTQLQNNYDSDSDYNLQTDQENGFSDYIHGDLAAQIIAGNLDGIAYNSTITAFNAYDQTNWIFQGNEWRGYEGWDQSWAKLLNLNVERNIDIAQLGIQDYPNPYGSFYIGNWENTTAAYNNVINNGRSGLGTILVTGSGNSGLEGMNTNISGIHNSRFQINVAAANADGSPHELNTGGASILVAVKTQEIEGFQASSQSSPIMAGITALILEANPKLGYRDVQEILAYSAESSNQSTISNGANNWNGKGLFVSHDLGFGLVDSETALRLAETWQYTSIGDNSLAQGRQEQINSYSHSLDNLEIINQTSFTDSIIVNKTLDIDWVEVNINLAHENSGDLRVILISPEGTESVLINRPLVTEENPNGATYYYGQDTWTLTSTHHWGENGFGEWKLKIEDAIDGSEKFAELGGWSLNLYGDELSSDNIYYYTNEYAQIGDLEERQILIDENGGIDTINASGMHIDNRRINSEAILNTTLNLNEGNISLIAGKELIINGAIENAFTGDGNDLIYSNAANNFINGGRGNNTVSYEYSQNAIDANLDSNSSLGNGEDYFKNIQNLIGSSFNDGLTGNAENNILQGKLGDDILKGGFGDDKYIFKQNDGQDLIEDANGYDSLDLTDLIGKVNGLEKVGENFKINSNLWSQNQQDLNLNFRNGDSITIKNFFSSEGKIENLVLQNQLESYQVSESGQIKVNFLVDGGKNKNSLGIFSLDGLENLEIGSQEFIEAATMRVKSNSELGHIILNENQESALFDPQRILFKTEPYFGEKSFQMQAGTKVALMLISDNTLDNIFSIANSENDRFAEFKTGSDGYLMAIEDAGDADYNDLIINIQGLKDQYNNVDLPSSNNIEWLENNYLQEISSQFFDI